MSLTFLLRRFATLRGLCMLSRAANVAFTMLYVWLVLHRQRVLALQDALDDKGLDYALEQRRSEGDR